ncbi:hypothetical protein ACG2E4_18525, partial [Halalkalibaculum sp. DA384]
MNNSCYRSWGTSVILLMLVVFYTSCNRSQSEDYSGKPNIVFIMSDDHSYQTLSAYDDRFIETPHLDR